MRCRLQSTLERGFSVVGVLLATLGLYLPWVKVNPAHEGRTLSIHLWGMGTGFEPRAVALLLPGLLILLLTVRGRQSRLGALVTFTTETLYTGLPFYHAETVLVAPFVSALGAYLTGLGGLCMILGGASYLLRPHSDTPPESISM